MTDRAAVAHLLRRAGFGPTAAELDQALAAGYDATVARLLTPVGADAGAHTTPVPDLGVDPYSTLSRDSTPQERQAANERIREQTLTLGTWWVNRLAAADHQLTEKLIFFWHGHWATSIEKVRSATLLSRQLDTFRRLGRGDFATLVKAMLRDPALIWWLDGMDNTRKAPNENLAREVMELFTLGVGAYTEDDVKAAARVLTGWVIDRRSGVASLDARRHDDAAVTILGQTKSYDIDSYADLLVSQPAHALFLTRRLWFRFASSAPIPQATAQRLATAYQKNRHITAALQAIFTDDAFLTTRGELVKQPVEWLVGAIRQLGLTSTALTKNGPNALARSLDGLGQVPLRPPSVGGWPAGSAWLTTAATQVRVRLAISLSKQCESAVLDPLTEGSADARLDALARLLVVDEWSPRTRAALAKAAGNPRDLIATGLVSPEYLVF